MNYTHDLIIIGAGPAGLAAAYNALRLGLKKIVLIEREDFLGGILPQCIHAGFGLKHFGQELTGPEYAQVFIDRIKSQHVEVKLGTMALSIDTKKQVWLASRYDGFYTFRGRAVILALGCRERTRGAISLPGFRPSGIYTAGVVQRMINMEGYLPGEKAVILGSGDIGLIMARRLTLEGCRVEGVYEMMSFSSGLTRNIAQCLEDYDIPLNLNSTVSRIYGNHRVEAVEITDLENKCSKIVECDTLLLSVGLIPENELLREAGIKIDPATGGPVVDESFSTSVRGIFACGNSLFVNDLADDVTRDAYHASKAAINFIKKGKKPESGIKVSSGQGISQIIPQKVSGDHEVEFKLRVDRPYSRATINIKGTRFSKIRTYLAPGELVVLKLRKKDFDKFKITGREIEFEVKRT
ncbi:MAG: NAD(P)/FAD-dependent oxidoreductase [Actinomycetia bacterium]|nr:NAD(P)/FAD-dependent oxidoreductase [Actinomycetes bacterium]